MSHPEVALLLEKGMEVAKHVLQVNRRFPPFGVTLSPEGQLGLTTGYTGDPAPPAQEVKALLLGGFATGARAGNYCGTALVSDDRVALEGERETDAVTVVIEHREQEPILCVLPYSKSAEGVEFGELIQQHTDPRVFVS